jgi:tetratricopeptide (TPR) repeat protein
VSDSIYREVERATREEQPAYTLVTAGRVLGRLGYWDLSQYALQQAIELRPDYAEAWAYLGEAVHQTGEGSGYQQISNALTLNPGSLAANTYMAVYYQRIGDYESSISYLEQAAQSDPNNLDLQVDLAAAIAASGDLDTALELYLQAVDRSSGTTSFPVGELIQFCVEYKVRVDDLALPLAREAITSYPSQPGPFDWHGLVLYTLGDLRNAERAFLRALEEDPRYASAHLHLGILHLTEGTAKLGRSHLLQAIELTDDPQVILVARRHLELEP